MRGVRGCCAFGLVAAALLWPAAANANHHLVRISEVYTGSGAAPAEEIEFVELQMLQNGENVFDASNAEVRLYTSSTGNSFVDVPLNHDPTGGAQRTVLLANDEAEEEFGVTADYGLSAGDFLEGSGGAVCLRSPIFPSIDCVSWGVFMAALPSPAGDPAQIIPNDQSLIRTKARGCSNLMELADDTDDSAEDLALGTPSPRPSSVAPNEGPCPNTRFTKTPKAKTTDRTPKFKFESVPDDLLATFECKLDSGGYEECSSPHEPGKLSRGKHKLRVRATIGLGTDPSPAKHSWKIVKP